MTLRTLIVGFGRSGRGLHWQVLRGLRDREQAAHGRAAGQAAPGAPGHAGPGDGGAARLFAPDPPVVWDVRDVRAEAEAAGLVPAVSLAHAARLTDPARTVVHLCTPPAVRPATLQALAALGFTRILAEKPLAADAEGAQAVDRLAHAGRLRLRVVAPWLFSTLTHELTALVREGTLGALRSAEFVQNKPRWGRTLRSDDHPTAFDVELPHAVGVALRLAGDARIVDASCRDMCLEETVVPRMGGARMVIAHRGGATTEFVSDLTSPVRERRVRLRFERGLAVGHYPVSDADHYATLTVSADGHPPVRRVLADDAFTACVRDVYRDFADGTDDRADDYPLGRRTVALLQEAKLLAAAQPGTGAPAGAPPGAEPRGPGAREAEAREAGPDGYRAGALAGRAAGKGGAA